MTSFIAMHNLHVSETTGAESKPSSKLKMLVVKTQAQTEPYATSSRPLSRNP